MSLAFGHGRTVAIATWSKVYGLEPGVWSGSVVSELSGVVTGPVTYSPAMPRICMVPCP